MFRDAAEPAVEGFILRTAEGEFLRNGIVVKASPATGTEGSILVEQIDSTAMMLQGLVLLIAVGLVLFARTAAARGWMAT